MTTSSESLESFDIHLLSDKRCHYGLVGDVKCIWNETILASVDFIVFQLPGSGKADVDYRV